MPGALSLPLWLSDKTAHALEYAGLAVVTMRALARGAWAGVRIATAISTLLIAVAHGVSGETFQQFVPGRQSDFGDLVADAVGAGAAVVAICAWGIIRRFSGARAGQELCGSPEPHRTPRLRGEHEGGPAMPFAHLLLDRDEDIAVVTVNRQKVLNALNRETMGELRQVALDLRHDDQVKSVIITGAGEKAFVAGADIAELARLGPTEGRAYVSSGQHVLDLIENLGKPVIAAVNGFALGGGCELAMACTLRVAADTARFGQPEVKLGLIPGYAGTQRLARIVGKGRALDLLLTGRTVDAAEALAMGLVNRVVPAASLMSEAKALARSITANGPLALRYAVDAVNRGLDLTLADGAFLEATLFGLALATDDAREGTAAFLEKRKPAFKGK